jgi:hypothetical protein
VTTTPVTIEQAAAILGVSASTIRRRIRAGALRVEEARRPQGVVWLVHLPAGTAPAAEPATVDTAPVTTTATAAQPAGDAIAAMIQATLTPIIGPLVAELGASRQTIERQGEQLVSQAETIGTLQAQISTLAARTAIQDEKALGGAVPVPMAHPGAVAARPAGDRRRRGGAAGGAEVSGKPAPPEKQCRGMVAGQLDRGVYWSPPHRCLNYAGPDGYCHHHRPGSQPRTPATAPRPG